MSLVILIFRLAVPLSILRWPLLGGIAALLLDLNDFNFIQWFIASQDPAGFSFLDRLFVFRYQETDKVLDMYYLTLELLVSLRWTNLFARTSSIFLYLWKFVGFVLFEITHLRIMMVFFPNIFEWFFLSYLGIQKISPAALLKKKNLWLALVIISSVKIWHEYLLHVQNLGPYIKFREELWQLIKAVI